MAEFPMETSETPQAVTLAQSSKKTSKSSSAETANTSSTLANVNGNEAVSGLAFAQATTRFITTSFDFKGTSVVVSVSHLTRVEDLRQMVYEQMRNAGLFDVHQGDSNDKS